MLLPSSSVNQELQLLLHIRGFLITVMGKREQKTRNHKGRQRSSSNCDHGRGRVFWDNRNVEVPLCINNHHLISLRRKPTVEVEGEPKEAKMKREFTALRGGVPSACLPFLFWFVRWEQGGISSYESTASRKPSPSEGCDRVWGLGSAHNIIMLIKEGPWVLSSSSLYLFHGLKRDFFLKNNNNRGLPWWCSG